MKKYLKENYGFIAMAIAIIIIFYIGYRQYTKYERFIIDQEIRGYNMRPELITTIRYQYSILEMWSDPPSDSIKCIRYRQAKKLADHYEHIQNLKCK
jgi:hypothetical protein